MPSRAGRTLSQCDTNVKLLSGTARRSLSLEGELGRQRVDELTPADVTRLFAAIVGSVSLGVAASCIVTTRRHASWRMQLAASA